MEASGFDHDKGTRIKREDLKLEKVVMKLDPGANAELTLMDWEKAGLNIELNIAGIGKAVYNEGPCRDIKEAMDIYHYVFEQVQKGNYYIENGSRLWLRIGNYKEKE